jgi:predicted ATPase/DNA-binding SARP family transcriptional activator
MGDPIEFRVLGPLEVVAEGDSVRLGGPRPRGILGVLLAHAGHPVSAERLIDQVWGTDPPPTAGSALQVHVSSLRKVLGDRLITAPSGYQLEVGDDELDALRFESMVAAARAHLTERPARAAADLAVALGLWRGEPYAGVPAGSDVDAARHRLAELRLIAVEDRMEAELTMGRHAQVVAELATLVIDHPSRERLAGQHMLALYRSGRRLDALAAFRAVRDRLAAELGVEPGTELTALARAIERDDPTLHPPSTIPAPPSRFIGRRRELEQLADILGESRMLTITGPGGSGKTRLALELARDTAADHRDGVFVIELALVSPDREVADRVGNVLGVTVSTGERMTDALTSRLRSSRALIVLDNCEHVLDRCASVASELLYFCSGLRILATSREPLGALGERIWPLAGLSVPEETTGMTARRGEAVRLLADRGAAARPGFIIDETNVGIAVALCRRLDGLPLAIELAAAQLRTLSLEEVADRLGRRLDLADRRARTTPDRHRTMRAAIGWSYDLLSPREQEVFVALSVFAGGFLADDAEQVCGAAPELLVQLVDRSMLTVQPGASGTRFRMLELVREFAAEHLADAAELRRRHALWCALIAESAAQFGPEYAVWLRRLTIEVPNMRAAMLWCLGAGDDPLLALRIAVALWWFWVEIGLSAEAREWLRGAMSRASEVPAALAARAYRAAASLARVTLDYTSARDLGERAVAAYRELGELGAAAGALNGVSITAQVQHDFTAALGFARESLALAEQAGDELQQAAALTSLGGSLRLLGRPEEAQAAFVDARRRFVEIKEPRGEADVLNSLSMLARRTGDLAESRELALVGLAIGRDLGSVIDQIRLINRVAMIDLDEGRPDTALALLAVTTRERERLSSQLMMPDELDEESSAWSAARLALGERAGDVLRRAADLPLKAVVDGLLVARS